MKVNFKAMRFPTQSKPAPLAEPTLHRPVCFSDDKEFYLQKRGPNGRPLFRIPKKGANAGQKIPVKVKMTLLVRGCEIAGVIYRATSRSSMIEATRPDGKTWKLTALAFARTADRCCGTAGGRRATLHLLISDSLLATYPSHHRYTARA